MLKQTYDLVMSSDRNPLATLPKKTRFQLMSVLAYMWTAVFVVWTGQIVLFGPSVVGHTILLVGVFFTADIFRLARRRVAAVRLPTP